MATRLENHEMRAVTSLTSDYLRHDNAGDWVWTGILSTTTVILYLATGLSVWTIVVGLVWLVGLYRTMNARLYQTVLDTAWNIGLLVFHKRVIWKAGRSAFPKFMSISEIVDVVNEEGVSQGLTPVGNDGTLAVVLKSDGSDMATAEPEKVRRRLEALGRSLTTAKDVGLSFVYTNRPASTWVLADSHEANMNPLVAIPPRQWELYPGRNRYEKLHTISVEQQQIHNAIARETSNYIVVTIPGNKVKASQRIKAIRGHIARNALRRHPGIHMANIMRVKLGGVGLESHVASALEVATLSRLAWDGSMRDMEDVVHLDEGTALNNAIHLPSKEVKGFHDHLEVDGNYIAFLRIWEMPEVVTPDWTDSLMGIRNVDGRFISLNMCVIGTAVSARGERWLLSRLIPIREAFMSWFGGGYRTPEAANRLQRDEGRTEELVRGRYRRYDVIPMMVVYASSHDELLDNLGAVDDALLAIGIESRQIKGARQQQRALRSSSGLNHL